MPLDHYTNRSSGPFVPSSELRGIVGPSGDPAPLFFMFTAEMRLCRFTRLSGNAGC